MSRRLNLVDADGVRSQMITLLSSQTVDETKSTAYYVGHAEDVTLFINYVGTVTAGEVVAESAMTQTYTGTWVNEGNSTGATDTQERISISGIVDWIRVRINTAIAGGGSVTVKLAARGSYKD